MESTAPSIQGWETRVRAIKTCRICGNPKLRQVLDLGSQCLAGLFDDGRPQNQLATPIPLEVVYCDAADGAAVNGCGLVQLRHTVPPDVMFRDYGYRSGLNTTMRRHLEDLSEDIQSRLTLKAEDILVDIGANDGTSLMAYSCPGIVRVGFEPSDVRPSAKDHGLLYIPSFFHGDAFQSRFPGKKARVITSIAMFYDIDDPIRFCRDIYEILSDDGLWVLEMSYWGAVLENNGFDAVVHEHLAYYSLSTLDWLFRKTGFELYDVSFNLANGGSVRCHLVKQGGRLRIPEENHRRVSLALAQERQKGYDTPESHARFRRNAAKIRGDLLSVLEEASRTGHKVYGYGASTKGNVLLQYCGVHARHLIAIADRNAGKEGRWTPGSQIRICSEEQMRRDRPDLLLILPWHFLAEFLKREETLRSGGTRFIVPFPEVKVV